MEKPDLKLLNGGADASVSDATGFIDSTATLAERLLDLGVEDALIMDGYDDCVVGVLERFGQKETIVLYDYDLVIQKLIDGGCEDYEEAFEYYSFNQLGAWVGDKTPGFLRRLPEE
jgi:hypothetical protein